MAIEREAKFLVPLEFELPPFDGAVDAGTKVLDATYYDTPDLTLATGGVTLRFRNGKWTLKLPSASASVATHLARDEIDVEAPPDAVPAELRSLIDAEPLVPVARLRSTRRRLLFGDDVELADDSVQVLDGDRLVDTFREVEVELLGDDESRLQPIVAALRDAGAGEHTSTPKVIRALTMMGRYGP